MSPWITVALALVTIAANAAVSIKIKFAPDAVSASKDLKKMALRVGSWALNAYIAYNLYRSVNSPEPVTRVAVFNIALGVGVLLFALIASVLHRVFGLIESMVHTTGRHISMTKDLADEVRRGRSPSLPMKPDPES